MSDSKTLREIIGEAIGEASMCWTETPTGIFDSTRASKLVDRILDAIESLPSYRKRELQTLIRGHMDAMRPLLDEWYKHKE